MSDAFRFVHVADVHLDGAAGLATAGLRRRLAEATRAAFERTIDLCLEERVHALLVAGDLFDDVRLGPAAEHFLVSRLRRLSDVGIATVVVSGNHDPGAPGGRAAQVAWPEGVTWIDRRQPRVVTLSDEAGGALARIVGAGHEESGEQGNLAAALPDVPSDVPAVALVHAQVTGAGGAERHARYAPCTPADLRAKRFDYWALGHVHGRQRIVGEAAAFYPGNLQGRHAAEPGAKGALLVSIPSGMPTSGAPRRAHVTFVPLAPLRFETVAIDLAADDDAVAGIEARVGAAWRALRDRPAPLLGCDEAREQATAPACVLRVSLSGRSPLAPALADPAERAELERAWAEALGVIAVELKVEGLRPLGHKAARGTLERMIRDLARELAADPERVFDLAGAPRELASLRGLRGADREAALRDLVAGIDDLARDAVSSS